MWEFLARQLPNLPGAVLVAGPKGTGKLELAMRLSRAALCEARGIRLDACGTCSACVLFDAGNLPDFCLLEPAADDEKEEDAKTDSVGQAPAQQGRGARPIKVEQIRALDEMLRLSAHRGGARVILIHPAERMHAAAANALLKTLEEPPARTHFVLVSHRPQRLPATIRSRCVTVRLGIPDAAVAMEWLRKQDIATDPALCLAQAGGAPREAVELARSPDYWRQRERLLSWLGGSQNLGLITELAAEVPVPRAVRLLQTWTYDLIGLKSAGRLRFNPDRENELRACASRSSLSRLLSFERELRDAVRIAEHQLNPKLAVESLLLGFHGASTP